MNYLSIILDFVAALAWPTVILAIVFLFRRQVQHLLASLRGGELTFPGGSISVALEKLEAAVATRSQDNALPSKSWTSVTDQTTLSHDPQLSVAAVRLSLDREVFKLLQARGEHLSWRTWNIHTALQTLVAKQIISTRLKTDIQEFLEVASKLLTAPDAAADLKLRVIAVGSSLNAEIRRLRLVAVAKSHMSMGTTFLLHGAESRDEGSKRHLAMSTTTSILPSLDYSYDIYREAAEDLISVSESYDLSQRSLSGPVPPGWHEAFHFLSVHDFVECLEFRERELLRLMNAFEKDNSREAMRKANRFCWPSEWGDLQWNTDVVRTDDPHIWEIEEDLFRTRAALNWYRTREEQQQLPAPNSGA